ncbi:MAG: coenzyme F420-0:L-glutamate ligase [Nocardioides sp.]
MITIWAPDGVGEIRVGDDLVTELLAVADLAEADVVVVTSKVVSKAEGRARESTREDELVGQTTRVVARRGQTAIVRNRLGLTMAAAGIDASNVDLGWVLLLPEDPDASARTIREQIAHRTGLNVGVIISDTAGRAWREGQADIAIGAAGVLVMEDFAGSSDGYGNDLRVTAPAVADELASAAELAGQKLGGRPFSVIRGRGDLVLRPGDHGPGAVRLIRDEGSDFFGLGAREAVVRAVAGADEDRRPFGAPADSAELAEALALAFGVAAQPSRDGLEIDRLPDEALRAVAFAHGWAVSASDAGSQLSPTHQ